MNVNTLLLGLTIAAALWTVLTPTLLRSAIGLALTSAMLTLLMFQMDSPLAAAFELSVCAGLITVVFVSTISLTAPMEKQAAQVRAKSRLKRFAPLLGVVAWVVALLWTVGYTLDIRLPVGEGGPVREVLWNLRRFDLLGQIIVLFVGVFGVVILFKEKKGEKEADQ
jgi:NADH-quinone oxidoreductase subunit J